MRRRRQTTDGETVARLHQILGILHKWGIHTLGDLARLDKEEIAARLGPEAVGLWERARGQSTRLLKFVQPPEAFAESFEFEQEVETIEPLLFMLRKFLEQLSLRLHSIYLVARELTLRMEFSNKQSYERCFKIPQPTNDVELLFRMLHTHLEDFKSDYPIVAVALRAEPTRGAHQQFGLFETALRDPNQLYETLTRLTGLLGAERIGTPLLEETHRPDAFQMMPFIWQSNEQSGEAGAIDPNRKVEAASSRLFNANTRLEAASTSPALRRFRPALTASMLLEKSKPIHLHTREIEGSASAQRGPYVASGNWWDDNRWSRREWDLQLHSGTVVRCHENPDGWQVDGIYD
jgi:protein ImuB